MTLENWKLGGGPELGSLVSSSLVSRSPVMKDEWGAGSPGDLPFIVATFALRPNATEHQVGGADGYGNLSQRHRASAAASDFLIRGSAC